MSKIDYEITIDVSGFSEEKKRRVQEAFFKLGIGWKAGGFKVMYTSDDTDKIYTNDGYFGRKYLCWSASNKIAPTHTYEQLMELAGMNDKKVITKKDLKDGHIVTYQGNRCIVFDGYIHRPESFTTIPNMDFDEVQKVETLEGDVLYEIQEMVEICDEFSVDISILKEYEESEDLIISKMVKYFLDKYECGLEK